MVGGRNCAIDATGSALPVVGKEEVVDVHRKGASGIGEAWSVACLSVGGGEAFGEALVDVGDGCLIEVAAGDDGMAGVAPDECTDAVCLNASIGSGFAQLAHELSRAALYGLAVRVDDSAGVFVLFFFAEMIALKMVVNDKEAVAVAVNPAGEAVIGACGIVNV